MSRRWSIAGQLLALQLGIIAVVLLGVGAVTLTQAEIDFRRDASGRVLSVAENLAARALVRQALVAPVPQARREQAAPSADAVQALSGLSFVMIVDLDGTVLADTDDPGRIGKPLPLGRAPPAADGPGPATGPTWVPARWSRYVPVVGDAGAAVRTDDRHGRRRSGVPDGRWRP